jgi:hypothetical protein
VVLLTVFGSHQGDSRFQRIVFDLPTHLLGISVHLAYLGVHATSAVLALENDESRLISKILGSNDDINGVRVVRDRLRNLTSFNLKTSVF